MSADLASALVLLVAPNYPFLESTAIRVMDVAACTIDGTPEQRELAVRVRQTVAEILALDEVDPVRQHFVERVHKPQRGHASLEDRETPEKALLGRGWSGGARRLPSELLRLVLSNTLDDPSSMWKDANLVTLMRLRLVSKDVKLFAETAFPHVFDRMVTRVAKHLVHRTPLSSINVAKDARDAAELFGRFTTLFIWAAGDEADCINELLVVCQNVEVLYVYVEGKESNVGALHLDVLRQLRSFYIHFLFELGGRLRHDAAGSDLWSSRPIKTLGEEEWDLARMRLPTSLKELELCALAPSELVSKRFDGQLDDLRLDRLWVGNRSCVGTENWPATFNLGLGEADCTKSLDISYSHLVDRDILGLDLGNKRFLKDLNLANNLLLDPAVLKLDRRTGLRSLDVSSNPFTNWSFKLNHNKTLRVLDLGGCLRGKTSPEASALMRSLMEQLEVNTTLKELSLSYNALDNDAVAQLQMSRNKGLKVLDLSRNGAITIKGLRRMQLHDNSTLKKLELEGCGVTAADAQSEFAHIARLNISL